MSNDSSTSRPAPNMTQITGVLIDPVAQEVREIALSVSNEGGFYGYSAIDECIDADTFDIVRLGQRVDMFVDDDGLGRDPDSIAWFGLDGLPYPIAGKALILGNTPNGDTVSSPVTAPVVAEKVSFYDNHEGRIRWAAQAKLAQAQAELRRKDGVEVIMAGPTPESMLPPGYALQVVNSEEIGASLIPADAQQSEG